MATDRPASWVFTIVAEEFNSIGTNEKKYGYSGKGSRIISELLQEDSKGENK